MSAKMRPHAPVRMCAVCRRRLPKAQLLRHTRSLQGEWTPDEGRTQPGRGRYLCSDPGCRERFARLDAKSRGNRGPASGRRPE
ncbi:MAG: DUF448 domain-containing protein [Deltaproteobacteria bacterium]|nr:DUF448 domain-containing protein [Deltaproteobacteria bacterium]